jgi:hypothetical protein
MGFSGNVVNSSPFIISILIEFASPILGCRFNKQLDEVFRYLQNNDNPVGSDAKGEIKEFASYAFDVLQMYTALAVTFSSGFLQLFVKKGLDLVLVLILLLFTLATIVFIMRKKIMQDPAIYNEYKDDWLVPPTSFSVIGINSLFIILIFMS